jgi:hypothetical protein
MRRRLPALLRPTSHGESRPAAPRLGRALLAALTLACTLLLPVSASFAHDRHDRHDRGDRGGHHGHGHARHYGERHHDGWRAYGWGRSHFHRPYPPPPPAWRYYHPHHHRGYNRY